MKKEERNKLDKIWREKCLDHAGYKSQLSGAIGRQINKESGVLLEVHHYVGRRNLACRWFLPNGIVLTKGEHTMSLQSAHENPEWFRAQMLDIRGQKWAKELLQRSNRIFKGSYYQVLDYLEGRSNDYL